MCVINNKIYISNAEFALHFLFYLKDFFSREINFSLQREKVQQVGSTKYRRRQPNRELRYMFEEERKERQLQIVTYVRGGDSL